MAFKGSRRTNAGPIGFLAVGMALLTLGAFVEGILLQFLGWTPNEAHALESSLDVLGFLSILYSVRRSWPELFSFLKISDGNRVGGLIGMVSIMRLQCSI